MDALIGHTGFIGNVLKKDVIGEYYNSKNIKDIQFKNFNDVYRAGVSSTKWLANKNPDLDKSNINDLFESIKTINCEKIILISTIGVYDNEPYGRNRKELEIKLSKIFKEKLMIVRLPAVYGDGLKKNLLYDLLNDCLINDVNLNDTYQWYNVNTLKYDIDNFLKKGISLIELFPEPITNKELLTLFDKSFDYIDDYENKIEQNIVPTNGFIYKSEKVKEELKKFIDGYN